MWYEIFSRRSHKARPNTLPAPVPHRRPERPGRFLVDRAAAVRRHHAVYFAHGVGREDPVAEVPEHHAGLALQRVAPAPAPGRLRHEANRPGRFQPELGRLPRVSVGEAEMHVAGRPRAPAVHPVAGLVLQPLAPEGMGRVGQDLHLVVGAAAATPAARPGGVRAELLAVEEDGVELLVDLDVGHGEPAQRADMADLVEPVAPVDRAGAGRRRAVIEDVAVAVRFAPDRDAEHVLGPARAAPRGVGLGERLPHRVDDLVREEDGAHRRRRALLGVDDAALRRMDIDAAERALVVRQAGVEE